MTTMSERYYRTLADRFDELDARRQRHGGLLGPSAETEYRRLGEAVTEAARELEVDGTSAQPTEDRQ